MPRRTRTCRDGSACEATQGRCGARLRWAARAAPRWRLRCRESPRRSTRRRPRRFGSSGRRLSREAARPRRRSRDRRQVRRRLWSRDRRASASARTRHPSRRSGFGGRRFFYRFRAAAPCTRRAALSTRFHPPRLVFFRRTRLELRLAPPAPHSPRPPTHYQPCTSAASALGRTAGADPRPRVVKAPAWERFALRLRFPSSLVAPPVPPLTPAKPPTARCSRLRPFGPRAAASRFAKPPACVPNYPLPRSCEAPA
mmetsp:Transcript_11732/g.43529  ORF Transcript_11732/g.43529 Transcript_11732/m.43529 type:complete len:255 (+) Transcript_11732:1353-2117(+)